ncbi:ankyrin repeat-containing domain protein [Flagelloscypha sp. PMI_526]|nr:ankyrin repeat-containing domain protein [Flagelloscypha sp. PMI_526]
MARVQKVQQQLDDSIFRDVNSWLQPIHQTSKLDANIQSRGESTCQWILRDPTFIQWLEAKHGLFWYHGLMGTGKTVTISFIIETLLARDNIYVAYYYFEFTNPQTLSEEAFYRSLVAQLAPASPSVMRNLHQKHNHGGHQPQLSSLKSTLIDLVSASSKPVFIFLDALDEFPPAQRKYLLQSLIMFCRSTGAARTHFMATSREDRDIRDILDGQIDFHLGVQGDLVRQDIAAFVDEQLAVKKWLRWPEEEVKTMRQILNTRADGQFRMVACQVDILMQVKTSGQLQDCLHSLPKTLANTYEYILNQIPNGLRQTARLLFAFLAFTQEYISMTELCALTAVDFGDGDDTDQLPVFRDANHFKDPLDLLELGKSFVSEVGYRDGETTLRLAHASVKEYLLVDSGAWLVLQEHAAHNLIASACLAVLLHFHVLVRDERGMTPFEYAYSQWYTHILPNSSPALLSQQQMLYKPFPWPRQVLHNGGYQQKYLLSSAASFCLVDFVEYSLATRTWDSDALGAALVAAAGSNYKYVTDLYDSQAVRCCRLLFSHGADVDYCGDEGNALHVASKLGGRFRTALQAAASTVGSWNCPDMIQFLVEHGADVNAVGGWYGSALLAAMVEGNLQSVECLVQAGADVTVAGGLDGMLNFPRAWSKSLEIVQFIVNSGVDVNAVVGDYGTPLQGAAEGGNLEIIQFLVQNGADVNAPEGEHGTALRAAANQGSLEAVKFLVQAGAEVNAVGVDGPALQAAAWSKSLVTVQFLIEEGADVNAMGGFYGTALQAAASRGSLDVVQFLVQNGADVKAVGGWFRTAVQAAARAGSLEVVRFLVQKGADVNIVGGLHGTALEAAVNGGNVEIIQYLVENGADVNAIAGEFGTALQAAVQWGNPEMVQALLHAGADVNVVGSTQAIVIDAATARSAKKSFRHWQGKVANVSCWNFFRKRLFSGLTREVRGISLVLLPCIAATFLVLIYL